MGGALSLTHSRWRRIEAPAAERLHTQLDPELGWAQRRSATLKDRRGPGLSSTTNAQGLRAEREFGPRASGAARRVACSADDFRRMRSASFVGHPKPLVANAIAAARAEAGLLEPVSAR